MSDVKQSESPLDLDNAGRDELIDGLGTTPVPPQSDDKPAQLEPPHNRRKKSAQREVDEQSAILGAEDVKKLTAQKPH
jgi:hypothetical protein